MGYGGIRWDDVSGQNFSLHMYHCCAVVFGCAGLCNSSASLIHLDPSGIMPSLDTMTSVPESDWFRASLHWEKLKCWCATWQGPSPIQSIVVSDCRGIMRNQFNEEASISPTIKWLAAGVPEISATKWRSPSRPWSSGCIWLPDPLPRICPPGPLVIPGPLVAWSSGPLVHSGPLVPLHPSAKLRGPFYR